jgi:hypothetical protein
MQQVDGFLHQLVAETGVLKENHVAGKLCYIYIKLYWVPLVESGINL